MAKTSGIMTIVLLAAGGSTRMQGRDKLLEHIDGNPLLSQIETTCQASKADEIIVVLRPEDSARKQALSESAKVIANPDWNQGMSSSIRAGLAGASPECQAILIVLADMPDLTAPDLNALIDAYRPDRGKTLVRATSSTGVPGHPVLIGRAHFKELAGLQGDQGARGILNTHANAIVEVPMPGDNALTDLDTPADWAAYRAKP